jgi:hypothetical protein
MVKLSAASWRTSSECEKLEAIRCVASYFQLPWNDDTKAEAEEEAKLERAVFAHTAARIERRYRRLLHTRVIGAIERRAKACEDFQARVVLMRSFEIDCGDVETATHVQEFMRAPPPRGLGFYQCGVSEDRDQRLVYVGSHAVESEHSLANGQALYSWKPGADRGDTLFL